MGWETLAMVGFQALSNRSSNKAAKKQAAATVQEGEYQAGNKARDTLRTTGRLTTQFLQSGLTLEGGPGIAIAQAFQAGYRDIGRITNNANTSAQNIMNAQRTKALEGIGGTLAGAGIGDAVGGAATDAANWGNQQIGSLFDPSPTGPYQGPLDSGFWG